MEPFVRIRPRPGHEAVLTKLRGASTVLRLTEYEMVRLGYRRCDVLHVYPETFDEQLDQVARDGLVWLPIKRVKRWDGFAHRHYEVKELRPGESLVYGVVARSLEDAINFVNAHKGSCDHAAVGRMLGYPECCIRFFAEVWPEHVDPIPEAALNTSGVSVDGHLIEVSGDPRLWQGLRYFGARIVPWLVHSFDCPESVRLADTWEKVARGIDDELTDFVIDLLSAPQEWDLDNGVVIVRHPDFIGAANSEKGRWIVRWGRR